MNTQNKPVKVSRNATSSSTTARPGPCQPMLDIDNIPSMPISMIDNTLIALRGLFTRSTQHLATLKTALINERTAAAVTREENMQLIQRNATLCAENAQLKAQLQRLEDHAGRVRDEKDALERICLRMKAREMAALQQVASGSLQGPRPPRRKRMETLPSTPGQARSRRVHPYASSTETLVDDLESVYTSKAPSMPPSSQESLRSSSCRSRRVPRTQSAPAGLATLMQPPEPAPHAAVIPPAAPTPIRASAGSLNAAAARLASSCDELHRFLSGPATPPARPMSLPVVASGGLPIPIARPSSTPLSFEQTPMDVDEDTLQSRSTACDVGPSLSGKPRHAAIVLDPSPQ
ncbi:hypothetical protein BD626DRAFT_564610 [Schizophyllum amplum]|uniref:Uncharacterized protein n=1 Tax=Schizophyllum amplum TaxID=97359 RepID=A0A550CSC7_9AGAR|nr:hypothetical protein BD626DRAFT_564610 [Auriculariopsis ampla]